jgi:hypothetical protein
MTTFRQIEANRRNATKSTGPVTEEGKRRSRCNAVRHGLTAETVIGALEDAEDYKAFEATIVADYDAQSAVERELALRLSVTARAGHCRDGRRIDPAMYWTGVKSGRLDATTVEAARLHRRGAGALSDRPYFDLTVAFGV